METMKTPGLRASAIELAETGGREPAPFEQVTCPGYPTAVFSVPKGHENGGKTPPFRHCLRSQTIVS